jgi:WD40 repeat protein
VVTANGKLWHWPGNGPDWQFREAWPVEELVVADFSPSDDRWLLVERTPRAMAVASGRVVDTFDLPELLYVRRGVLDSQFGELHDSPEGIDSAGESFVAEFPMTPARLDFLEKMFPDIRTALSTYGRLMNRLLACSAAARAIATLNVREVDDEEQTRYDIWKRCVVRLWKWGGSPVQEVGWPGASCTAAAFSHDGRLIAVGLQDGQVRLATLSDGAEWRQHKPLDEEISGLAFLPNDRSVIAGGAMITRQSLQAVPEGQQVHDSPVTASACSSDGHLFATADEKGRIVLWDALTGSPTHIHVPRRIGLKVEPDPHRPGKTRYIPTEDAAESTRFTVTGHMAAVRYLRFSSEDQHVVSIDDKGNYWVWDPVTGNALQNASLDSPCEVSPPRIWAGLSEVGPRLALLDASGELAAWAFDQEYREVLRQSNKAEPAGLAISPDGAWLAVCTRKHIEVIHLPDGQVECCMPNKWSDQWDVQLGFLELPQRHQLRMCLQSGALGSEIAAHMTDEYASLGLTGLFLVAVGMARDFSIWDLGSSKEIASVAIPGMRFDPIACARRSFGFAYAAGGMVVGWQSKGKPVVRRGTGDLRALAEGTDQYPYRVLAQDGMTVVESSSTEKVVARYPLELKHICLHPGGRTWCGSFGREVHVLHLEGPEGDRDLADS